MQHTRQTNYSLCVMFLIEKTRNSIRRCCILFRSIFKTSFISVFVQFNTALATIAVVDVTFV